MRMLEQFIIGVSLNEPHINSTAVRKLCIYYVYIYIITLSYGCLWVCMTAKVTGSYMTRVKNVAFFASLHFNVTEGVDWNS